MPERSDTIAAFRVVAEQYVAVIDAARAHGIARLYGDLVSALPTLYAAAVQLPDIEPESADAPYRSMTHGQWATVFDGLLRMFLEDDRETAGSLADDLADIYRNVKEGLDALSAGRSEADVVWEWRFSFWSHWGEHAANALRIVHARLADAYGPPH